MIVYCQCTLYVCNSCFLVSGEQGKICPYETPKALIQTPFGPSNVGMSFRDNIASYSRLQWHHVANNTWVHVVIMLPIIHGLMTNCTQMYAAYYYYVSNIAG